MGISQRHATQRVWSAVPATQNEDGGLQSAALATENATHLLQTMQKYCACNTKRLSTRYDIMKHMLECDKVPRLPRETKLRDVSNREQEPLLQGSP